MEYILIQTDTRTLYQEIQTGQLIRICDLAGNTVTDLEGAAWIIDANPPLPLWALPDVAPVAPPPETKRITKLAYMDRFTDTELALIYTAAKTNIAVEIWLARFNATTPELDGTAIDLLDPRTTGGLYAMESAGLLAPGRASEIINA
jgi:hypothetical protein